MTVDPPKDQTRWFVLQAENAVLRCPVVEARFQVADLDALRDILGDEARDDVDVDRSYPLDDDQLTVVAERFGVKLEAGGRPVLLTPWSSARDAPYLNHTGFELALMLEGRKPFAKFSDVYPSEWLDAFLRPFDPFVAAGRIVRRTIKRPFATPHQLPNGTIHEGIYEVYFALPGQEWRIDANLLLFEICIQAGWNEALERFEGALLGYEDWQNDWHLDHIRREGRTTRWAKLPAPR
jgi:hypothetical protein